MDFEGIWAGEIPLKWLIGEDIGRFEGGRTEGAAKNAVPDARTCAVAQPVLVPAAGCAPHSVRPVSAALRLAYASVVPIGLQLPAGL